MKNNGKMERYVKYQSKEKRFKLYPDLVINPDRVFDENILQLVVVAPSDSKEFSVCINNSIMTVPSYGCVEVNEEDANALNIPINLGILSFADNSYQPVSAFKYMLVDNSEVIISQDGELHKFVVNFDSYIKENFNTEG